MTKFVAETHTDVQVRDQKIEDLEEAIFQNGVTMERGLQECREGLASLQIPDKAPLSEAACQEHSRGEMPEHEKKFNKGER